MVKKILPVLFIIGVWLLFSKPFFLENKIPFPTDYSVNHFSLWSSYRSFWGPIKNPAQPDVVSQIMPWRKLTIESLSNLDVPFWNPYSFSGTPHLANYQSSVFSPTNILYFIFNFNIAWSIAVLVQPLLAGIFTYLFARSLKRSELASLFSAISFMFCGFITTWMSYTTLALAICFLPLALFAIEKYFDSKKLRYLVILSISFPLSFFSGHFQTSIYLTLFVVSYLFFKLYETKNKFEFLSALLFSFFGVLLSAPQIIPSIELYKLAFRSSVFQKISAIPIKHLTTLFAPDFYGNPVTRNNLFENYAEWNGFSGTIPLLIGLYSLTIRSKKILFFFLMAALSLLFSLDTPILDALVNLKIPVFSTSSVSRIIVLFSFSIIVLAAFGLDKILEDIRLKRIKGIFLWLVLCLIFIAILCIFVIAKVVPPVSSEIALKNLFLPIILFAGLVIAIFISYLNKKLVIFSTVVIVILTSFDLFRFANKWQPFSQIENTFPKTKIISKLQTLDNTYRTLGAFGAEGAVYYHIPSTEGYDPLYINRYGEFIGSLDNGVVKPSERTGLVIPTGAKYMPKVIDLLGIRYILLKKSDEKKPWAFPFKKYPNKFNLIYKDREFSIYENKDVFPRAFIIGGYEVETDKQKIINKILDKNFNLRNFAVIEKDPKIKGVDNPVGDARILSYTPNRILIETNANHESLLILTDNYYPGWRAKINEREVDIFRADYTFRAIPIPRGKNRVEFYYDSDSFKLGVYLAVSGIIFIFITIFIKWYTNYKWNNSSKTAKSAIKLSAKIADGRRMKNKLKK